MKIKSISCKKCHAPLSVLGNSARSKNLICQYCGTVMDVKNNFKALYTITQVLQNDHLSIGTTIKHQNIKFTIAGYISYVSNGKYWISYQLFSTTHGYAQLIEKDKHFTLYRTTHYLPDKSLWMLKKGNNFTSNNQIFAIQSFEIAEIYYAAGNLLQAIKQGKRSKYCFAYCNKTKCWFYSEHQHNAVNYYVGVEFVPLKRQA